jgi:hypothetical protein
MTSDRVMFVVEYEDGRAAEFSIDRWTLSLGEYAARIIARERQEKGDLPPGAIRTVRQIRVGVGLWLWVPCSQYWTHSHPTPRA